MSQFVKSIFNEPSESDYLNAAKSTANWLLKTATKTPEGYYWENK